jgi:hypothetical protein
MSLPVTIPNIFQNQSGPLALSLLDANFSALAAATNDRGAANQYFADLSGAANTFVVTVPLPQTFAYTAGYFIAVLIGNTNTSTTVNINVNGLGNQQIKLLGGQLPAIGQLISGTVVYLQYNGSNFVVTSAQGGVPWANAAGNVAIPAPSSGVALSISGVTGSRPLDILPASASGGLALAANINSAISTDSPYVQFQRNGTAGGFIGSVGTAGNLIVGSGVSDFCIGAQTGNLLLTANNAVGIAIKIIPAGNVTVATPSSGDTLTLAPSVGTGALIATSAALTNNAGASAGTLTNAPAAGNPTKWIKINDNGTIRSIPAW